MKGSVIVTLVKKIRVKATLPFRPLVGHLRRQGPTATPAKSTGYSWWERKRDRGSREESDREAPEELNEGRRIDVDKATFSGMERNEGILYLECTRIRVNHNR